MLKSKFSSSKNIAGQDITLQTGTLAKQANGAITIHCGDTVLLATATMSKHPKPGLDFFPLTLEFSEKMYASGKIPGGFFKRESRPSTAATLKARLIDRPLRPCFPEGMRNDVQVVITVLSYDPNTCLESLSLNAASAALSVSNIPFNGPVGGAVIGLINGEFVVNPSDDIIETSDLSITVSGTKDAILMIEASANEVSEETIIEAILLAHETIKDMITLQEDLASQNPVEKLPSPVKDEAISKAEQDITHFLGTRVEETLSGNKQDIDNVLKQLQDDVIEKFATADDEASIKIIKTAFDSVKKEQVRQTIIKKKIRPDGRRTDEIRPIETQVRVLPSVHGSALFTRGETQSLGVVTLGSSMDSQIVDGLREEDNSTYFFHYNFPPYSVGECGRFGTSRRELGHGALAERALKPILPSFEDFPYTIRIVSEILESNGSSSMASVCAGSMALMDTGAPIKAPVSGIAMGLLIDGDDYTILSDIQGLEDHYGDMDFKVAGTTEGITALQLDIKVSGLSKNILIEALEQAKAGRFHILNKMNETITASRTEVSENAPKIHTLSIDPEKVGLLIGPGGKTIRKIEEESGAKVVVSDGNNGEVTIAAKNKDSLDIALNFINGLTKEPKAGEVYPGRVVKILAFGAFVEILPGKEGLIHISKLSKRRLNSVDDVVSVGDKFEVSVQEVDAQKRINLVPTTLFE
jgi:polyribonucleotide nucleotidyltransferase